MAITSAICNSFKEEILQGGHCLNASGSTAAGNTIKLALYSSNSATLSKSTTVYAAPSSATADPTSTYEVTTTSSGYTGGGNTLTNIDVTLDSDTAVCDFSDPVGHRLVSRHEDYYFIILLLLQDSRLIDPSLLSISVGTKQLLVELSRLSFQR